MEFTKESLRSWIFFVGRFLMSDSLSLLWVCSDFLFVHDSVLVGWMFLGTYPFGLEVMSVGTSLALEWPRSL